MHGNTETQADIEDLRIFEAEVRDTYRNASLHVRNVVSELVKRTSADLIDHFYRIMIDRPGAHFFLDHEIVSKRLREALRHWLSDVFQRDLIDIEAFGRRQTQVGWAHARIKVPEHLISRGARELKQKINHNLRATNLSREDLASAIQFVSMMLDLSLDIMTLAYINRSERTARSDEAFRLFSLSHNLATERERQRAVLSEWAQSLFFELQVKSDSPSVKLLSHSEFGLWIFHRAPLLFDRSSEYERLVLLISDVDILLEALRLTTQTKCIEHLRDIKDAIDEINSLVALLFDRSLEMQGARDPLTQLLNRKFINTVISAEIETQKTSRHPFSLLLIEIDQFDELRMRVGEAGADIIVQRTAQMLFDAARHSDSVFSMGRETFLIVEVEADLATAEQLSEKINERYTSTHFTVNGQTVLDSKLNIGVVEYDGHPDPREIVNRAQKALLRKKPLRNSRNG